MMCVCNCMCTKVGSNPCKKIHLLCIAHPIVGKYFQVLKVHWGMKHIQDISCKENAILVLFCIL